MTFLPCIYVLFHLNVGSSQCSWPLTASGNPEITRDQQKDRMVARKSWKQRPGGRGSVCVPVSTMPGHQCLRQSGLERSQDIAIEICRHHCVTPILPPASHPIQRVWGKLRHRNVTYLHPWPLNLHKQSNSCCVFLVIPSSIFSPWIPESLYSYLRAFTHYPAKLFQQRILMHFSSLNVGCSSVPGEVYFNVFPSDFSEHYTCEIYHERID